MPESNEKIIEEKFNDIVKEYKKHRIYTDTLIIIVIILLLLLCFLGYKMGKIGYQETSSTSIKNEDDDNEDSVSIITVTEDDINIQKISDLNIFANEKFGGEKIIAPMSSGTYKFCVKNESNSDITYNINFADYMTNPVNMKYRLKIDNVYIKGSKDTYVDIDELNLEDIIVLKDSNNVFTLEWYWENDDEADTYIGSQSADHLEYYALRLYISSWTIVGGGLN